MSCFLYMVIGHLSDKAAFQPYLALSNLKVLTARANYLLVMEYPAMRLGAELHDLDALQELSER